MALKDNLVSHWKLDEASGNALDAHGSNDLTETSGTIGSATGKVGNARDFESADTERFEHADSSDFSPGDVDFCFACWVKLETAGGNASSMIAKWDLGANEREYALIYEFSRYRFYVSANGTSGVVAVANSFGEPSVGDWHFVVGWHDATNNTINIQVDNGTVDSVSHSAGVRDGTATFCLGSLNGFGGYDLDGLLDEVSYWKGRFPTSDERTEIWNGGAGKPFDDWDAGSAVSIAGIASRSNVAPHRIGV